MIFSEITSAIGITEYPIELENIYKTGEGVSNFCEKSIYELDEKFPIIGDCKKDVAVCLDAIKKNEALWEYTACAAAYLSRVSFDDGSKLKLPDVPDEYPTCYYSTLLMIMALPGAIDNYLSRGFSKDEIVDLFKPFTEAVNTNTNLVTAQRYNWLRHYTSAVIFKTSLFTITPRIITAPIMLLKNRLGEYKLMMIGGRFHKSGKILGSAGYTDEEGAFDAEYSEDEKSYTGHEVIDSIVSKELSVLSKDEWSIVTKQGDGMAGVHIPRGSDLTDEKMTESFKEAFKITKERYPEFNPKTVHCSTWMLDPKLTQILGPNSKITGFINRYLKYPIISGGKELFGFVFPKNFDSYESLPEDTSLQRKLKAMYINGEFIHAHAGFVFESDEW